MMSKECPISVYILCGGTNKRMGTDKGLIHFNGKTFIERIIEAVNPITKSVYLITKNNDYKQFGFPLIPDIYHNKGPVGAIYSALKHSNTEKNIILSCDIPNITTKVIKSYLIDNFNEKDVLYVADDKREYPLIGIYSKKITSEFETALKKNHLKLVRLIEKVDSKCIKTDPEHYDALQNINTKEELKSLIDNSKKKPQDK